MEAYQIKVEVIRLKIGKGSVNRSFNIFRVMVGVP